MQGVEGPGRELWDAAEVVGHLVKAGSMFAFLAEHRGEVFGDEDYADLFAADGRPSLPATRMAAVLTLQALHELSDRECAEAVRCDLRWKVACGLSLLDEGFDPSSLVYWRRRIANSQRPHRVNDAIRQVIEATGVLRGRRRRAVDSTILDDAVATQDTVTQLISAIRRVARQVPDAATVIASVCTGHDYSAPGKPRIDWTDPDAKEALVSALVTDATAVLAALTPTGPDTGSDTGSDTGRGEQGEAALALLALVAGQDVEPAEGSDGRDGRWRIARRVAPERVISTVDPQARHTRKSPSNRRDGYRAHLEGDPETGLITDEALTPAAGPDNADAAVAAQFLARAAAQASTGHDSTGHDSEPHDSEPHDSEPHDSEPHDSEPHDSEPHDSEPHDSEPHDSEPVRDDTGPAGAADHPPVDELVQDGAGQDGAGQDGAGQDGAGQDGAGQDGAGQDGAGQDGAGQDGRAELAWYCDSAYGTGEFQEAIAAAGHRAVIKPKPVQPVVAGGFSCDDFTVDEQAGAVTCPAGQTRPLSANRTVTFGALCRDCPLRARCTTSKTGRSLSLHEHDDLLRGARADWATDPDLREDYRQHRPNIERTVAQVATHGGRRIKLRYRGTIKNNAWLKTRTAGLNLRTLLGRGLARVNGIWVLAT